jgi:hypothetical protein
VSPWQGEHPTSVANLHSQLAPSHCPFQISLYVSPPYAEQVASFSYRAVIQEEVEPKRFVPDAGAD